GDAGWVVSINNDIVYLICKSQSSVADQESIKTLEVHRNWVALSSAPFVGFSHAAAPLQSIPRDFQPWINTRVIIVKKAWKGRPGVVQAVTRQGEGHKIVVRLESYNPNTPFCNVELDYEDVAEENTKLPLLEYSKQRHHYVPANAATQAAAMASPSSVNTSGGQTPLSSPQYDTVAQDVPAWDPNSSTPLAASGALSPSPLPPPLPHPEHELLNSSLLASLLKVTVHGAGFKGSQTCVRVMSKDDGTIGFRGIRRNEEIWFTPECVQPRRPTPNRGDNGPMVVTKGIYRGLRVRRLSHRHEVVGNKTVSFMRCVAVLYEEGEGDKSTNLEVEVSPEEVCLAWETKEEKQLNKSCPISGRFGRSWARFDAHGYGNPNPDPYPTVPVPVTRTG
ncbi:hypothetical protein CVT24_012775, partial [Panaeolus cyanescens]